MRDTILQELSARDAVLSKITQTIPTPQIISSQDVFHDLMSCVLEQQIHYRSTKNVFKKMLQRAEIDKLSLDNFDVFEQIGISSIKLSESKYETVLKVIEYFSNNQPEWDNLPDSEVIEKLGSIKGIGKWTIDMILLYTLERPNVFPFDDFHLKQIMVSEYALNEKQKLKSQMLNISENWGEQKSLAVKYLLGFKEYLKKGECKTRIKIPKRK